MNFHRDKQFSPKILEIKKSVQNQYHNGTHLCRPYYR